MPTAEIITIGTEILLGEIVDTNTRYLSGKLREQGVDIFRQITVGDNINRIAQEIQASLPNSDIIITTGGLGPTIDDPTRKAVAQAIGVEVEFRDELWEQVKERHLRFGRTPTENNKRQAYVPQGAIAVSMRCSISRGTPGSEMMEQLSLSTMNAGAVPTGFSTAIAPWGM